MSMEYDSENAGNERKDIPRSKFIYFGVYFINTKYDSCKMLRLK